MSAVQYASANAVPREGWRWPHFSPGELACRCGGRFCGGEYFHDPLFLDALEGLRGAVGRPLKINSGRRCRRHNAAVGGAPLSRHALAIATDVSVAGWDDEGRRRLLVAARGLPFGGFGFARSFLHLDRRPRRTEWDYSTGGKARWTGLLN